MENHWTVIGHYLDNINPKAAEKPVCVSAVHSYTRSAYSVQQRRRARSYRKPPTDRIARNILPLKIWRKKIK